MWGDSPSPARRPHPPSEALQKVVFGGQVTEEETESLGKRKPCSAPQWKEMSGSGIFAAGANGDAEDSGNAAAVATPGRAAPRNHQHLDWHPRAVLRNREGCEECAANEEKQLIEKVTEMQCKAEEAGPNVCRQTSRECCKSNKSPAERNFDGPSIESIEELRTLDYEELLRLFRESRAGWNQANGDMKHLSVAQESTSSSSAPLIARN